VPDTGFAVALLNRFPKLIQEGSCNAGSETARQRKVHRREDCEPLR
jgi:hypothetical protein